jgi:isopenicillin-N epimerase
MSNLEKKNEYTGYRGFGSFMMEESVEELVYKADTNEYIEPEYPLFSLKPETIFLSLNSSINTNNNNNNNILFGHTFGKNNFFLDDTWVFINHGAFGATCRIAMEASRRWREYAEMQPLKFIDRELFIQLVRTQYHVSKLLHTRVADIAILPNATYGLNVAIKASNLQAGEVAIMLDIGYGSVKKILGEACILSGARLILISVQFPIETAQDIVKQVKDILSTIKEPIGLCVFDHITSNSALVLPVKELVTLSRTFGARHVLIDGAHGIASQELDIPSFGADWYISNAHKWLCSTKGVAIMHVSGENIRKCTRSIIISHGYGSGFSSEFSWDGCRDYSGALALTPLLYWWNSVGGLARARTYCTSLLQEAISLLTKRWSTKTHGPLNMYGTMACIELPSRNIPKGPTNSAHAKAIQDRLYAEYKIEVPIKVLPASGTIAGAENLRLYVRISAATYNELDDYEKLANAICSMQWDE